MRFFIFIFLLIWSSNSFSQSKLLDIDYELSTVKGIGELIQKFDSFGEKIEGNQNLHNTAAWLKEQYLSYGYTNIRFDTFSSPVRGINYNVVVTYNSNNKYSPKIIIGSHYDSKGGPGANDNGTGVATTLKIAENLMGKECPFTIEFVNFAAEEQGFYGSKYHAEQLKASGDSLYFYFNLDQLGGTKGATDNMNIVCERDENNNPSNNNAASHALVDRMVEIIEKYTAIGTSIDRAFSSDYQYFQIEGYTVVGLYQSSNYPFTHSAADSFANVDTTATLEIAKGALACILELGQFDSLASISKIDQSQIQIYPNPSRGILKIESDLDLSKSTFSIINIQGKTALKGNFQNRIDVRTLPKGTYLISIKNEDLVLIKRFVLI